MAKLLREWPVEAALLALVALHLLPLALLGHFPSQDGPAHVYTAWALGRLDDPASAQAAVYERRAEPVPNQLATTLLGALVRVAPGPAAERLLVALSLVTFCAGFALLARGDAPRAPPVALLGPALACGWPLSMGFHSWALGWALVPWAWWLASARAARGPRGAVALAVVGLLAWLAHLAAAGAVLLGVGCLAAVEAWRERSARPLLLVGAPLLPAAALVAWWVVGHPTEQAEHLGAGELAASLLTLRALATHDAQRWAAGAAALLVALLAARAVSVRPREALPWVAVALVALAAYVALPDSSARHDYLSARLSLLPWLALAPLAGAAGLARREQAVAFAGACLALLVLALPPWLAADRELRALRALGPRLEPGHAVLLLEPPDPAAPARVRPLLHAAGWLAVERDLVDAGCHTAFTDHFPLRLRAGVDLPPPLVRELAPARLDPARLARAVRYVVVRDLERLDGYRPHLERAYREVAREGAWGLFERLPAVERR